MVYGLAHRVCFDWHHYIMVQMSKVIWTILLFKKMLKTSKTYEQIDDSPPLRLVSQRKSYKCSTHKLLYQYKPNLSKISNLMLFLRLYMFPEVGMKLPSFLWRGNKCVQYKTIIYSILKSLQMFWFILKIFNKKMYMYQFNA